MLTTTGNDTGIEPEVSDDIDLAVVIGAAAAGAVLLAAVTTCAIWLVRRRATMQLIEPPRSRAFYQGVGAARPAYLGQNGSKYPPPRLGAQHGKQPRMNNYIPRCIDNRCYDWKNAPDWYQPQPYYRHQ